MQILTFVLEGARTTFPGGAFPPSSLSFEVSLEGETGAFPLTAVEGAAVGAGLAGRFGLTLSM